MEGIGKWKSVNMSGYSLMTGIMVATGIVSIVEKGKADGKV